MISLRASTLPLLSLLVALAGCSAETGETGGVESTSTAQSKATVAEAQGQDRAHHARHRHGPDFLLGAALHESINLSAEQRTTIERLIADEAPKGPPAFDRSRVTALAAGVRAGKVDVESFKGPNAAVETAMKERLANSAKALATLHATLTKEQRVALVDAVSKRAEQGPPKDGPHAKDGAHAKRAGADGHHRGGFGPMHGMLAGISLTDEQRQSIKAKLDAQKPSEADREAMKQKFEGMRTEMKARLQTFASDTFDANAFVTPPEAMKGGPAGHADRMGRDLAIVVSVLDASQREQLAARLEQGPPARGQRPGSAPKGEVNAPAR